MPLRMQPRISCWRSVRVFFLFAEVLFIRSYITMVRQKIKGFTPEKKVEQEIMAWAMLNGWSLSVLDSKALKINGKMRSNPGIPVGCPDLVGNCPNGFAAYIELKRANADVICRVSQRNFLLRKIDSNAFACVVDSAEKLERLYSRWVALREISLNEARDSLREALPKKVLIDGKIYSVS